MSYATTALVYWRLESWDRGTRYGRRRCASVQPRRSSYSALWVRRGWACGQPKVGETYGTLLWSRGDTLWYLTVAVEAVPYQALIYLFILLPRCM